MISEQNRNSMKLLLRQIWIPAFAGMTEKSLIVRILSVSDSLICKNQITYYHIGYYNFLCNFNNGIVGTPSVTAMLKFHFSTPPP